jgi:hypothetical protein
MGKATYKEYKLPRGRWGWWWGKGWCSGMGWPMWWRGGVVVVSRTYPVPKDAEAAIHVGGVLIFILPLLLPTLPLPPPPSLPPLLQRRRRRRRRRRRLRRRLCAPVARRGRRRATCPYNIGLQKQHFNPQSRRTDAAPERILRAHTWRLPHLPLSVDIHYWWTTGHRIHSWGSMHDGRARKIWFFPPF